MTRPNTSPELLGQPLPGTVPGSPSREACGPGEHLASGGPSSSASTAAGLALHPPEPPPEVAIAARLVEAPVSAPVARVAGGVHPLRHRCGRVTASPDVRPSGATLCGACDAYFPASQFEVVP